MGKTKDLFKKIRDAERIFHAKISTTKDRKLKILRSGKNTQKD